MRNTRSDLSLLKRKIASINPDNPIIATLALIRIGASVALLDVTGPPPGGKPSPCFDAPVHAIDALASYAGSRGIDRHVARAALRTGWEITDALSNEANNNAFERMEDHEKVHHGIEPEEYI